MPFHLYNSFTKQEEEFTPVKPGEVTMYSCGPTVYSRPHIGNYSSFLMADLLRRWLQFGLEYKVTHAKNITDVGHLVADADEGEDKVEKQAREEHGKVTHESVIAIARKYEEEYLADETALNLVEPEHRPRATEFINQIVSMVNTLLQKGNAYTVEDGIYFSVESDTPTPYGKLSGNTLENLCAGARIEVNDQKKHAADFALWKFCVGPNEHHALRWPSPGEGNLDGFPGWHIECSAMSSALLGDQIDIHTGGEDLIFPHHECEIAQSECTSCKSPFVKHWVHKRFIDLGDTKMSKRLGNVLCLPDITNMGFSALDLRYYLLSHHYRTQLKFTEKGLEDAHKARKKIMEWCNEVDAAQEVQSEGATTATQQLHDAMNADLNTPSALAVVFDAATQSRNEHSLGAYKKFVELIRNVFGCFDAEEDADIPEEVVRLLEERRMARENKEYAKSDELRDAIAELGYEVRDGEGGQSLSKR